MPVLQHLARHRLTRILAIGAALKLAIGAALKLAIGIIAYALLADMHQLATAAL